MTTTMQLDALMAKPDTGPDLAEYRSVLLRCAGAGRPPDDLPYAERLAGLARKLGYDVAQIRADHAEFTKLVGLERRFDASALARAERELEPLRKAAELYNASGRGVMLRYMGWTAAARDRKLAGLERRLKAAAKVGDDEAYSAVQVEMQQTRDAEWYICSRDTKLKTLQEQFDKAITGEARQLVSDEMKKVKDEGDRLAADRRVVEERVIVLLSARDRLNLFKSKNSKLFAGVTT